MLKRTSTVEASNYSNANLTNPLPFCTNLEVGLVYIILVVEL